MSAGDLTYDELLGRQWDPEWSPWALGCRHHLTLTLRDERQQPIHAVEGSGAHREAAIADAVAQANAWRRHQSPERRQT